MLILLVRKVFGDRILLRVALEDLRFNVRLPSLDLEVLDEVIKKKCYCLVPNFEPKENDIIMDLGAYIGAYTIHAAKKGAYVIAVEPASTNLVLLLQNIFLNQVNEKVKVLKVAVGGQKGIAKFPAQSLDVNPASFSLYWTKNTWAEYENVPLLTLSDVLRICDIGRVDIVKMDIEGAEVDALEAANMFLEKYRPKLVIEVHGRDRLEILIKHLVNIGYTIKVLNVGRIIRSISEGDLYYLYAVPLGEC